MAQDANHRAAAYIRVSQERAARNGYGLGAQETDVQKYATYKDLELVEIFREEGVSGYKKDRPALDRLLADARAGRFQTVIFPSIDRAGRSVRDVIEIDQALRALIGAITHAGNLRKGYLFFHDRLVRSA